VFRGAVHVVIARIVIPEEEEEEEEEEESEGEIRQMPR